MNNDSIFFCDLIGTYVSNKINKNREIQIANFIKALGNLIKDDEKLFFTFTSTESPDIIEEHLREFKKYNTNPNIVLYFESSSTEKEHNFSKVDKIMSILNNHKFKKIYFADDTQIYHDILEYLISENNNDIDFISFNLHGMDNDIIDLTNLINTHIMNKEHNQK